MIRLNNLSRAFASKWALKGLELDIADGEIFGIVGPNGAGKTTAIRIMSGLLLPDEGQAVICGYDVAKEPLKAKSIIGYVPDKPFLYEKLTAREFLTFVSSIHRLPKDTAGLRIDELIRLLGIEDISNELIEGYSQGMRQRLVFASALIHSPRVLLIDEPFVGLDLPAVILIKGLIKDLSANRGVTVFLATHSLHIAGELCHRIGLIKEGKLISIKGKQEILSVEGGLEAVFLKELEG